MEELLKKLRALAKDDVIKEICGDRVFMNNRNKKVQLPYVSYNPVITANTIVHSKNKLAELILERYVTQVNFYCKNDYNFTIACNRIKKVMCNNGFKCEPYFVDTTDEGNTWICFRFSINI